MSSSCEVKTCWLSAPDLKLVGDNLKSLYDRSVKVGAGFYNTKSDCLHHFVIVLSEYAHATTVTTLILLKARWRLRNITDFAVTT